MGKLGKSIDNAGRTMILGLQDLMSRTLNAMQPTVRKVTLNPNKMLSDCPTFHQGICLAKSNCQIFV
jgi:hypothetical protein